MRDLPDATPMEALSPASVEFLRALPATRTFRTALGT
jgi:hypothetical protein